MNSLLKQMTRTAETWNGGLSLSSTGSKLLDYFSKVGTYSNRSQDEVDANISACFNEDEQLALRLVFASRLITRKPSHPGYDITVGEEHADEVATGFGRKDEFYKAITWMHNNRPEVLYRNLHLIPVFGSWKDFVTEPLIDVLDRKAVYQLFSENLDNQLLRKYLPQARSASKTRTERDKKRSQWAHEFAKFAGLSPKDYRKLKSAGAAHVFQRQMSANEWDKIHFNGIPGRAMTLLTSRHGKDGKGAFERHGLVEKLTEWVKAQPSVKFNGYPYELARAAKTAGNNLVKKIIFDKQFENLLGKFGNHNLGNTLCALDTSGSMSMEVVPGVEAIDICVSLGLVFSSLNIGHFKDYVIKFDDTSELVKLKGSFTEKLQQAYRLGSWGSTNFQSVIDLLVRTRNNNPEIPLEEYPETLLVVSDMQFNCTGYGIQKQTNYEVARQKLQSVGLEKMKLIWWYVNGAGTDFPSSMDDPGVYLIGGFDPVMIKTLMGDSHQNVVKDNEVEEIEKIQETPYDGMIKVLKQPIFELLQS